MKYLLTFVAVLASMLTYRSADAAIIVNVNVASNSSTVAVNPGDTVTADIFMQLTETTDLAAYNFRVLYDASELSFVSRNEFAFGNLNFQDPNNPPGAGGIVVNIDNATFDLFGTAAPFGPVRIASLVFTAMNPNGDASDIDIAPDAGDLGSNAFFASNGSQYPSSSVVFSGASVTAVPEPGSMAAIAIVGGVGALYRRRRNKVAKQQMA